MSARSASGLEACLTMPACPVAQAAAGLEVLEPLLRRRSRVSEARSQRSALGSRGPKPRRSYGMKSSSCKRSSRKSPAKILAAQPRRHRRRVALWDSARPPPRSSNARSGSGGALVAVAFPEAVTMAAAAACRRATILSSGPSVKPRTAQTPRRCHLSQRLSPKQQRSKTS